MITDDYNYPFLKPLPPPHTHTHTLQVQAPPGTVIGYVNQDALGILHPWFSITNTEGETVLKIKGPFLGYSCYSDTHFEVGGTSVVL